MQNKTRNIIIGYWYKELELNPISKINDLENNLKNIFQDPFLVNNNLELGKNISVPRIQAINEDKTILFSMSLMNANFSIKLPNELDNDEIVLMVNENIQLFYDLLKEIYDVKILYTSIKIEINEENENACDTLVNKFKMEKGEYEDFSIKKVIRKDDIYYISQVVNTGKEINFNIEVKNGIKPSQNDIFDRSMLISLQKANVVKNVINTVIEVNDRLAFNNDANYLTTKENIRGMISEFKEILNNQK